HAPVVDLGGDRVPGSGQESRPGFILAQVILSRVDEGLRVFDSDADREGFAFEQDVPSEKQTVDIPRAVTRCENHRLTGDFLARRGDDSMQPAAGEDEIGYLGLKPDFA